MKRVNSKLNPIFFKIHLEFIEEWLKPFFFFIMYLVVNRQQYLTPYK